MNNIKSIISAVAVGMVLSATSAFATPNQCKTGSANRQYKTGKAIGKSLATQVWTGRQCSEFPSVNTIVVNVFKTRVQKELELEPNPSNNTVCRQLGLYEGMVNHLKDVRAACQQPCELDGKVAGELGAILYCELSIALGGLEVPLILGPDSQDEMCGIPFETTCKGEFTTQSLAYKTVTTPAQACAYYTLDHAAPEEKFVDVWQKTTTNMCLYELP